MSLRKAVIRIVIPILILGVGFFGMRFMELRKRPPKKEVKSSPGALVEVERVSRQSHKIIIYGTGTVQPEREIEIIPEVSGKVVYISPKLKAGGFFKKGELLFEIESIDYRLAVEKARAALTEAEFELTKIESQASVARKEWERLRLEEKGRPNPLVLYEPQLRNARAKVGSARATLRMAELDLERTKLYAPFNCRVSSEALDIGQYVREGTSLGRLVGTDRAEIVVPLPVEELSWLKIPRHGGDRGGSPALIRVRTGDGVYNWQGRIVRSLGEVDPKGRMSRVVVAVEDPYHLRSKPKDGKPDLETGMFVETLLYGREVNGVFAIPRKALREGSFVWIVGDRNRLNILPVEIVHRERETVFVKGEMEDGSRVVLTNLIGAAEGMRLRPVQKGETK